MANIIPVVFCFDKRIILGASVSIKSLINNAKDDTTYDIRVFHSDLGLKEQKSLSLLTANTRHNITFHYVNPEIFKDAPRNNHSWTEIVYYRFLVPQLLPEYNKAIYSDVDVLFKDDLSELYKTNIEGYEIGAVAAEKMNSNYWMECSNENIYFSGLILFNNKRFREDNIITKLLDNAKKYYSKLRFFDLDLMNITLKDILKISVRYCVVQGFLNCEKVEDAQHFRSLSTVYTKSEIEDSIHNPIIIHYSGAPGKPWRTKHPYPDYKSVMDSLPKELNKLTFRDIRKKLFSKG